MLDEGIRRRDADRRERMFGEDALWHYKRGVARARLGRAGRRPGRTCRSPLAREARDWVRGRAHAELGQIRARSRRSGTGATASIVLPYSWPTRGNDPIGKAEAETLLTTRAVAPDD